MQNRANPIGIGCFAEGHTLRRVFRKALENFVLGQYEDICPLADRASNHEDMARFFSSVIHFGTEKPDEFGSISKFIPESSKITGFFLGLNKQAMQLIVFFLDSAHRPARLTARLEKFNRLRKKRLQ